MRALQRFLVFVVVGALGFAGAVPALAQGDATPAPNPNDVIRLGDDSADGTGALGEPVIIRDLTTGDEYASITVTDVVVGFEEFSPGYEPDEGFHYIGVELAFENLIGIDRFEFATYDYVIIPQTGRYFSTAYVSVPADSGYTILSSQPILGGRTLEGWLFYEVPEDAALDGLYFLDSYELHLLAPLSDGPIERPAIGEPTSIFNDEGVEVARITVDEAIVGYEERIEYQPPAGSTYVAVGVTIENLVENDRFEASTYSFNIVDENGRRISTTFISQENAGDVTLLETTEILGGESLSGHLIYAIPEETAPAAFYYFASGTAAMLLAFGE